MSTQIIPAILPKDSADLAEKLTVVTGFCEMVQIDFCDTLILPPAPWATQFSLEAHLMMADPVIHIATLVQSGFERVLIQVERVSSEALAELIHEWRGSIEVATALEIETPLEIISSFAHELQSVQLMGIAHIGRQGEPFDPRVIGRVSEIRKKYPHLTIAVDGGVSLTNAPTLISAGASRLVVGSAIFGAEHPREAIEQFKQLG